MSRSNKSKIAVTLLGALAFGASAQARDVSENKITKTDSFQIDSATTSESSFKSGRVTIGKTKQVDWKTVVGGTIGVLAAGETVHSIVGAATDLKFGSHSLGRLIRNHVKKNKQPGGPNEQDDKSPKKNFMPGVNPENYEDKKEKGSSDGTEEYKNKVVVPNEAVSNEAVSNIVSSVPSKFQQNKLQSINRMNQMVNQMPVNAKQWGNSVVKYLQMVVVNNPNGLDRWLIYYISTGQGVITDCNCFQDHNFWCFGIEVTYRENNEEKKDYVYLSPGLQMPNGGNGVKSWAASDFQNGLVTQWPDRDNRGPLVCGHFIGYN